MTRKKPSAVEVLAGWLNGVARETPSHRAVLREIVSRAAKDAAEMYQDDDEFQIRALIGKFAAALDEDEMVRKQDGY